MIYDYADKVLKDLNRRNLRLFDKLSLLKFDELNVLKTVSKTYDESADLAKKRFKAVYEEVYLAVAGDRDLDDDIMDDWLLDMLEDYDALTHYRFNEETERKKMRTAEALIATKIDKREVDKALRLWTLQLSAYVDRSVLDGRIQAFKDMGVKRVKWHTYGDERVCQECDDLDGKVFPIDDVPSRLHWRCRCWVSPVE